MLGTGAAGQRGTKAQSAEADSDSLLAARSEALALHQRTGSDRSSPRSAFIPVPVRADSSPDLRNGPRGGSHRAMTRSPVPGQGSPAAASALATSPRVTLTPEEAEAELFEQLMAALQNEEAMQVIEDRIREAAQRQGHHGRTRSGASFPRGSFSVPAPHPRGLLFVCSRLWRRLCSSAKVGACRIYLRVDSLATDNEALRFDRHRGAVS